MEENILQRAAMLSELLFDNAFIIAVGHIDLHALARGDFFEYPRQILRHRMIFIRKRNAFGPRPAKPGRPMFFPFCRKGIAQRSRSFFENF